MRKYLTIGELSDLLDLSAHTIRYYEKEGLIKPKHMTDKGYRLYDFDDVYRISSVMILRDSEIPIKDIRTLMSSYEKEEHTKLLEISKQKIDDEIERLCQLRLDVERSLNSLNMNPERLECITEKKLSERFFRIVRFSDYDMNYTIKNIYDLYKNNNIMTEGLYKSDIYYILQEDAIGYGIMEFEPIKGAIQLPFEGGRYATYSFLAREDHELTGHIEIFMWQLMNKGIETEGELLLIINSMGVAEDDQPIMYELQLKIKN